MGPDPVVTTGHGPVRGLRSQGVLRFKGIRYGSDTGGANRFLPPAKPAAWREVLNAFEYGPPASQDLNAFSWVASAMTEDLGGVPSIYPNGAEQVAPSEDCLFLNVWTPAADGARRPVMVWLHGGAYTSGSGGGAIYDGTNLAHKEDVVVVTVNHRLNALGYAYMADLLGPDYASSGNVGMLDLVLALEWVRDNIAHFGGDPGLVTIFGESGGGSKVSTLLAMPRAKGLFHRAIVQSGAGLTGMTRNDAAQLAEIMLQELGITRADRRKILEIPSEELSAVAGKATMRFAQRYPQLRGDFSPVVDGVVLLANPFDPVAPPTAHGIPLLIGNTRTEQTLFMTGDPRFGRYTEAEVTEIVKKRWGSAADKIIATAMRRRVHVNGTSLYAAVFSAPWLLKSHKMAELQAAQNSAPVYFYKLDWLTPVGGGKYESPHTLDLPLMFDTVEADRVLLGPGPEPQRVADQMRSAWAAFARTGNPANRLIPDWPAYTKSSRSVMIFDVESKVVNNPDLDIIDAWENTKQ
jgi:para-nitrobenzyl esterase